MAIAVAFTDACTPDSLIEAPNRTTRVKQAPSAGTYIQGAVKSVLKRGHKR
jgi:hypothetical protein